MDPDSYGLLGAVGQKATERNGRATEGLWH